MLALNQQLTAEQRIAKAIVDITAHDRYIALAGVLMIGTKTVSDDVPTACTNGRDVVFGREMVDALTDAEVNALMQQLSPYNRLIVSTLVETGMRWGELASLQWGDVDLADQHLIIRKDKDNTFRVLPLTTRATESLRQLHSLGQIPFVCRPDSIRKGLRDAAGRAEIKHVHPHMLRHTFATRLRDRGVPLDRIMELLGHKTMAMTLRYAKARPEQLREAIRALEG